MITDPVTCGPEGAGPVMGYCGTRTIEELKDARSSRA
jgi:hypothetical protein